MRKKGTKNKNYSAEFKISVIMDMRKKVGSTNMLSTKGI